MAGRRTLGFIPYDTELAVHQDDAFLDKGVWDAGLPEEKRPLLLHYHPLVIYRHQVLKQADVVSGPCSSRASNSAGREAAQL
ncbi:MAG: hypothetical protein IPQ14_14595 [Candidatus Microthrix sp.]|uniref:hypothetical protein n=1 Tax=Candidatus Neomicrothrix sp. TaxID=2719034 RepID=UPI0025BBB107|nr:hypothetical protein [Candidatus Microthrix sp.]MBL0205507.1 hypothetical protein [Candidatus Microthrix sp.]